MSLTGKPGQDIENFGNKVDEMARYTSGTGYSPIYLSTLVITAFVDCEVLAFHMKSTGLCDLVESNPKALSVDEIIRTLKTKSRSLRYQGL